ncbi:MAG: right-handed parallel beta-helix repeat-containing protein, partial [Pseudomonadota bacterium]
MRQLTLVLPILLCPIATENTHAGERTCTPSERAAILKPATSGKDTVHVKCSLTLKASDSISKGLLFLGPASSNTTLNCNGATIASPRIARPFNKPIIHFKSKVETIDGQKTWARPENVTVKNCKIIGSIRSTGMALNGEGTDLRTSSRRPGHIGRAQAAAPHAIRLSNLDLVGIGTIPLYVGPGTTALTLENSRITGRSNSVGIYLDAESDKNVFRNNKIAVDAMREQMAVDGSANNQITNNRFSNLSRGGIYLYRNCGEGGTVRHQPPERNRIEGNHFFYRKFKGFGLAWQSIAANKSLRVPAIWLGSRSGFRPYCSADGGYNVGSSISNKNFARFNRVINNRIVKLKASRMIIDDDKN